MFCSFALADCMQTFVVLNTYCCCNGAPGSLTSFAALEIFEISIHRQGGRSSRAQASFSPAAFAPRKSVCFACFTTKTYHTSFYTAEHMAVFCLLLYEERHLTARVFSGKNRGHYSLWDVVEVNCCVDSIKPATGRGRTHDALCKRLREMPSLVYPLRFHFFDHTSL